MATQPRITKIPMMSGIVSNMLMDKVSRVTTKDATGRVVLEVIADKLIEEAEGGSVTHQKLLFEYLQGRPGQTLSPEQLLIATLNLPPDQLQELAKRNYVVDQDKVLQGVVPDVNS